MKTVVIGGGACGASTAARLRRLDDDAEILILEKSNEISIANCGLPYYCSGVIDSESAMHVSSVQKFKNLLNIDIKLNACVTDINRDEKSVTVNGAEKISYDKLVLAPGAYPFVPDIEGARRDNIFTVRMLQDAEKIKSYIKNNNAKNAVVIGGGFIGVEMAESLAELNLNTTLIEQAEHILPPIDAETAAYAQNELRKHKVKIILKDGVKSFNDDSVILASGSKIPFDIAILAIGVKPDNSLAKKCGLEIGLTGGIKVNEHLQTSDPDIYAGGDGVEVQNFVTKELCLVPLAGPANRQGRIIADNINGIPSVYKNTQGSAVVKIFDLTIACTGANESQLKKAGIEYLKTFTMGFSHANYYPCATRTMHKLLFDKSGKILGMQSAGYENVEKRVDVVAAAMRSGLSVGDLIDLELCYAPPYSSAKDPVNVLGMHADNILRGFVKPAFFEDLEDRENIYIIDVRSAEEFGAATLEGAVNIQPQQLRENYGALPAGKKVILICNTGFQTYVASRILLQKGLKEVYSLAGGQTLYNELLKDKNAQASEVLKSAAEL